MVANDNSIISLNPHMGKIQPTIFEICQHTYKIALCRSNQN